MQDAQFPRPLGGKRQFSTTLLFGWKLLFDMWGQLVQLDVPEARTCSDSADIAEMRREHTRASGPVVGADLTIAFSNWECTSNWRGLNIVHHA
jgi:hypothetical protein